MEKFTEEETAFLRQNWKELSDSEIAATIGVHRSVGSVVRKRKELGLVREFERKHGFAQLPD